MMGALEPLRHALKASLRAPGFAAVVTLTLTLGIGVNAAIFSLVRAVAFGAVPVRDPDRVTILWSTQARLGEDTVPASLADFLSWREAGRSFADLAAMAASSRSLSRLGEPRRVAVLATTADLFEVWGIEPLRGRGFLPGDDLPGAPRVALASYGFWRRQFGGRDALGETLWLDRRAYTLVGVLAPEVEFGDFAAFDLWVPLTLDPDGDRGDRGLTLVTGRLRPGASVETAQSELDRVAAALAAAHPETNDGWGVRVSPLAENLVGSNTRRILLLLVLMVGFVLAIACANVAGMLLARGAGRRRELATRLALGAGRGILLRQLLGEGLVPALGAAAAGLLLAHGLLAVLARVAGRQSALLASARIDRGVLVFTLGLALATPLLFGLLPALRAARTDLREALREVAGPAGGRRGQRSRRLLVAGQVAMAATLLVVCGLLGRTLRNYLGDDLGFDERHLLSLPLELPEDAYDPAATRNFYDGLLERARELPGVRDAALASDSPLGAAPPRVRFEIAGRTAPAATERPQAFRTVVSPGYFAALGVPVLRGRPLAPGDRAGAVPVAVVSATAAARYWPGADPVGERILLVEPGSGVVEREVVGVVGDVGRLYRDERAPPQVYLPFDQQPSRRMALLARAAPGSVPSAALRREVQSVDPELPVDDLRTMVEIRRDVLAPLYAIVLLFAVFAGFAAFMAAVGLYGLVSYTVAAQRREFGLRMAVGAAPATVAATVLRQGLGLTAAGIAAGFVLAGLAASLLRGVVHGVSPWDPATFAATFAAMAALALLAHLLPAYRAARVDPASALKTV